MNANQLSTPYVVFRWRRTFRTLTLIVLLVNVTFEHAMEENLFDSCSLGQLYVNITDTVVRSYFSSASILAMWRERENTSFVFPDFLLVPSSRLTLLQAESEKGKLRKDGTSPLICLQ